MHATSVVGMGCCDRATPTPTCQRTADVKELGASGGGQETRAAQAVHTGGAGNVGNDVWRAVIAKASGAEASATVQVEASAASWRRRCRGRWTWAMDGLDRLIQALPATTMMATVSEMGDEWSGMKVIRAVTK
ncbi:hypothetical protein ACLOJK_022826 [Asimina triloba]